MSASVFNETVADPDHPTKEKDDGRASIYNLRLNIEHAHTTSEALFVSVLARLRTAEC